MTEKRHYHYLYKKVVTTISNPVNTDTSQIRIQWCFMAFIRKPIRLNPKMNDGLSVSSQLISARLCS